MKFATVFLIAVFAATSSTTYARLLLTNHITKLTRNEWPPSFCNKLDCPKYTVITSENKTWEERLYVESNWVSTRMSGRDYNEATEEMFMRLFDYIEGANVKGIKIPMAAPVIMKATIDNSHSAKFFANFTMSFYLPYEYQNTTAPQPKSRNVFLWTMPESKMFVSSFDGYANEEKDVNHAKALAKELGERWAYDHGYLYTAGYNSPWQILGRHNEVWWVGTN